MSSAIIARPCAIRSNCENISTLMETSVLPIADTIHNVTGCHGCVGSASGIAMVNVINSQIKFICEHTVYLVVKLKYH